ncbi:MAG: hypothetical protein ACQGVC_01460 [Myxococcota bacterium]
MIDRRAFLTIAGGVAGGALLWPAAHALADAHEAKPASTDLAEAIDTSGFVYVSPLKSDGSESTCHGEVWFGPFGDGVVLITAATTWKARALGQGLDRARVWVGDHGRWKQLVGRNEAFRKAPSFDARAEIVKDDALLEELLALYDKKYPDEIADWRDKMRSGYHDGSRLLIRYTPVS